MPVVLGQSWNTSLMEAVGRQQGLQARAGACSQALSPVAQVATDPRFGRLAENYGEDPHLVSAMAVAEMTGIQGKANVGADANASLYMVDPVHHPFCQVKHYAAYGASAKDSYTSAAGMSERTLYEVYLRPWLELGSNGLRGVMASTWKCTPVHQRSLQSCARTLMEWSAFPPAKALSVASLMLEAEAAFQVMLMSTHCLFFSSTP